MAVAFGTLINPALQSTVASGTLNFTLAGTTTGNGLAICVVALDSNLDIVFSSASISGETVVAGAATSYGNTWGGRWFYVNALSAGGDKTLGVTYANGQVGADIGVIAIPLTGHNLASGFNVEGNGTGSPASFSMTTTVGGCAIAAWDIGSGSSTLSGYTATTVNNSPYYPSTLLTNTDVGGAGSKTINPATASYYCLAVAIAAGASSTKPAYYYAQL